MSEDKELLKSFLERTYYTSWKKGLQNNYNSVEFIINDQCDQNCKYCYMMKYGKFYFDENSRNETNILKNLRIYLKWMNENGYKPKIELFTSEIFAQDIGYNVLDVILDELPEKYPYSLIVPSNMSFIFDDKKIELIEKYIEKFRKRENKLFLSASIDGPFMEENRPMKDGRKRDDVFYHKLFSFCKKHNFSFHPMIYSDKIEMWPNNFLWFQEKFKEYDIPWYSLYLLEVRNKNWTINACRDLAAFLEFLVYWLFDFLGGDRDMFVNHILGKGAFNILSSPFLKHGRGLSCSIQGNISIRLGDLTIVPCHRTAYKEFETGKYIVKNDKIVDIEPLNVPLAITIKSTDQKSFPFCEDCMIKSMCYGGCLGSQYEVTGDLFTPIPTVCRLEHYRIMSILKAMKKINVLGSLLSRTSSDIIRCVRMLEDEYGL